MLHAVTVRHSISVLTPYQSGIMSPKERLLPSILAVIPCFAGIFDRSICLKPGDIAPVELFDDLLTDKTLFCYSRGKN
jgi:hypothetical protein